MKPMVLTAVVRQQWSGILVMALAGCVALSIASPAFLTEFNAFVLLRSICVVLLAALSQMIMLAVGQLNLSVGALGGLAAIVAGGLMEVWGVPGVLAAVLAVLIGALAGCLNGLLTVRTGINGFIVTLATASAFTGINLGITKAVPFYNLAPDFVAFGSGRVGPFPYLAVVPIVVTIAVAVFLNRTFRGRQLLAVGGNATAAELSGISVSRAIVLAHVLSGTIAAAAGVLAAAQLGSAQPTIGADWIIISFAGPIIGGAALTGGAVSITGTVIAVVLIGIIENAMVLLAVDPYWVTFLLGALILLSVWANRLRIRQMER